MLSEITQAQKYKHHTFSPVYWSQKGRFNRSREWRGWGRDMWNKATTYNSGIRFGL